MASIKTLNAKNLEALGAGRLAALLIEVSKGSAVAKRRLRLGLAGAAGGDDAAREIHRRITSIGKARTYVDWQKTKALVTDLESQHRAILDHVTKADPREAVAIPGFGGIGLRALRRWGRARRRRVQKRRAGSRSVGHSRTRHAGFARGEHIRRLARK